MSHEIVDLLTKINNSGTTVVMVTHEHDLVRSFQRRVIVIQNGKVVSDTPDPTYAQFKTEKHEEVTDMFYFEESVQQDQVADVFENVVNTAEEEAPAEENNDGGEQ